MRTSEDHFKHTGIVLCLLQRAGEAIKLKNCPFLTNIIDYLGYIIRPGRLKVGGYTVDAICQPRTPTKVIERRSFSGLCNIFRRFVPDFPRIASTSSKLFEKKRERSETSYRRRASIFSYTDRRIYITNGAFIAEAVCTRHHRHMCMW